MKSWFLVGHQRLIPTYGKHEGAKLVGILDYVTGEIHLLDYVTGEIHLIERQKYDAQVFLEFLKQILELYPTGKIILVLDNARIHHAKLLKPFLEEHEGQLELMFLPPYSPNLNMIEGLWKWLKNSVINNVFIHTKQEISARVKEFEKWVNQHPYQVIDRLCLAY